jgi:hypothetical protein
MNFYKITVQVYGRPLEVIYASSKFYAYRVDLFIKELESKGLKAASFSPELLTDPDIIECMKIKEAAFSEEFAKGNLKSYDSE